MTDWTCVCGARNEITVRFCDQCGAEHQRAAGARVTTGGTRVCGHCNERRPVEQVGVSETYACPTCQAISVWLCHKCGARTSGAIQGEDGVQRCASCRRVA